MPTHAEHHAFGADRRGHLLGFEDDIGNVYHIGAATFVKMKYEWAAGGKKIGEAPSRLYRIYESNDGDGPQIEHSFCWDFNSIKAVQGYDEHIDEATLATLANDPRAFVESDLVISDEVLSIVSNVSVYTASEAIPASDTDAIRILGTVSFDMSSAAHAPKIKKVSGFVRRRQGARGRLATTAPRPNLIVTPRGVQPCAADDHRCHLAVQVAPGGGPELPQIGEGEILRMRADDVCINAFEYRKRSSGPCAYAYPYGDPYADPLHAVVVHSRAELAALPQLDDETAKLLRKPASQRHFLLGDGADELVPGARRVKVPRAAIVRQIVIAAPPLLEGLRVHYAPQSVFRFNVVASSNGKLTACAPLSASRAMAVVRSIITPSPASYLRYVQYSMQEAIIAHCRRVKALDPVEFSVTPFMFMLFLSLPGADRLQRSAIKRDRLLLIFRDDAHFNQVLGFIGWHAPEGKQTHGYNKVCVPQPPASMLAISTVNPTAVPRASLNYLAYDTDTQQLTLRLSVARFNSSKRVRGADVHEPMPDDGQRYKYVLSMGWVPISTHAPNAWQLRRAMPPGPAW